MPAQHILCHVKNLKALDCAAWEAWAKLDVVARFSPLCDSRSERSPLATSDRTFMGYYFMWKSQIKGWRCWEKCLRIHALWISLWSNVGDCLFARNRVYVDVGFIRFEFCTNNIPFLRILLTIQFRHGTSSTEHNAGMGVISTCNPCTAILLHSSHSRIAATPPAIRTKWVFINFYCDLQFWICSYTEFLLGYPVLEWCQFFDTTRVHIVRNFVFIIPLGYG